MTTPVVLKPPVLHGLVLGAVTLRVADLPRVKQFYQQVVGLQPRTETADQVALGTEKRTLLILQLARNAAPANAPRTGLYHVALRVPSRAALADWLTHFLQLGRPGWQGASDHWVSEALYLADPEGNGIEIYCDRPRSQWPRQAGGQPQMATVQLNVADLLAQATEQPWRGIDAATDIGHIHLQVRNLAEAHTFYVATLGLQQTATYGSAALFVAADGYHHHLGLNVWHSRGAPPLAANETGLVQFSLLLPSAVLATVQTRLNPTPAAGLYCDPAGIHFTLAAA